MSLDLVNGTTMINLFEDREHKLKQWNMNLNKENWAMDIMGMNDVHSMKKRCYKLKNYMSVIYKNKRKNN
jgi:hypothetical protein